MDLNGECHHERSEAPEGKVKRQEKKVKKLRARRKIIRVDSKETQDYVREAKDVDQEKAEEMSFVPSAISVPQKPLFRCDNQCSEKTLSFWQFASVVIKEGEESYTTNLCQQCYNKHLEEKGEKSLTNLQWYEFCGEKGASWKAVENEGKRTIHTRNVISAKKEKEFQGFERRLKKKGKQDYRVSCSWNRQPECTWSKRNAAMTRNARKE